MTREEIEIFKKVFFDLPSRSFGETYVEAVLRRKYNEQHYEGTEADAYKEIVFETGIKTIQKIEYKAARALFEEVKEVTAFSMFDKIMASCSMSSRKASIEDIKRNIIKVNLQNIKCDKNGNFDFDYLRYVIVCNEGFYVFGLSCKDMINFVKNKEFPNWCSKHGSKESGLNGQFPITGDNINWHIKNTLIEVVSWEEVASILKSISYE